MHLDFGPLGFKIRNQHIDGLTRLIDQGIGLLLRFLQITFLSFRKIFLLPSQGFFGFSQLCQFSLIMFFFFSGKLQLYFLFLQQRFLIALIFLFDDLGTIDDLVQQSQTTADFQCIGFTGFA